MKDILDGARKLDFIWNVLTRKRHTARVLTYEFLLLQCPETLWIIREDNLIHIPIPMIWLAQSAAQDSLFELLVRELAL